MSGWSLLVSEVRTFSQILLECDVGGLVSE